MPLEELIGTGNAAPKVAAMQESLEAVEHKHPRCVLVGGDRIL